MIQLQFNLYLGKNGAGVSFTMLDSAGGSNYTFADSTVATQDATTYAMPHIHAVRLGFLFQQDRFSTRCYSSFSINYFLDGKSVGTQAATTVPDDTYLWK